jgi:hypothetical protein
MSTSEPSTTDLIARRFDVPEDVRAELDAEEKRMRAEPLLRAPVEQVPEDVIAERDLEARSAEQELHQHVIEGRPVAEDEPRS